MAPKKSKKSSKKKNNLEPVGTLADSLKDMMNIQNAAHAEIGEKKARGDHSSMLPAELQEKQKQLQEKAKKAVDVKIGCRKFGLLPRGGRDDGDQSKLKGDEAQVLRYQWESGMDYNPTHPENMNYFSEWLRVLFTGDYDATIGFINKVKVDHLDQLLEARESLLNVSAVFHVIIGARTLCGDKNPQHMDLQKKTSTIMTVKKEYEKILAKLLELGANIHAKDVAGYTPLHHCLTCYSNPLTVSMARQLLKAGADPNLQNRFGCTPLFESVKAAKFDAVELLLDFGADPDVQEYDAGISCRQWAPFLPKIAELFCKADKRKTAQAKADAKTEAGGSLWLCKVCGVADDDNKRCTGCYMVWYCGQKCQLEDWTKHKVECKVTKNQYKEAQLEDREISGKDFIAKKWYVHKAGDIPSKKHFVIKVQITQDLPKGLVPALVAAGGPGEALFVYNKDRSLCGHLEREEGKEVYDKLVKSIREEGFSGQKGFFYAIYTGKGIAINELEGKKNLKPVVKIKINPEKILPVEKCKW